MFIGRYWLIVPMLAIAGSLARKKSVPATAGTLPTHGPLFVVAARRHVVLVGALTFFPALALGPIVEHLQLFAKLIRRRHVRQDPGSSALRRADRAARAARFAFASSTRAT